MSNEMFSIGEVAIYHRPGSPFNGEEVTIIAGLENHIATDHLTKRVIAGAGYTVDCPAIRAAYPHIAIYVVAPEHLRKKRPPREDLEVVRWADCPWQPEKVST